MDYFNFAINTFENCLKDFPPGQDELVLRTNVLIQEMREKIEDGNLPSCIVDAEENNETIMSFKDKIDSHMDELIGAVTVATEKVNKELEELELEEKKE